MMGRVSVVALIAIYIFKPLYTVDETEQAVVLEWGVNPVKVVKEAGLHFKWPWPFQSILKFDERLLEYDAQPREIITKDKKTLILDNYARWRINDPIKLLQTVKNENGAQTRIDDIVYSELRVETASHDQIDIIAEQRESIMQKVTERCNSALFILTSAISIPYSLAFALHLSFTFCIMLSLCSAIISIWSWLAVSTLSSE